MNRAAASEASRSSLSNAASAHDNMGPQYLLRAPKAPGTTLNIFQETQFASERFRIRS